MNETDLFCHTKAAMRITHDEPTILHIQHIHKIIDHTHTYTNFFHFRIAVTKALPKYSIKSGNKYKATKYPHIGKQTGKGYSLHW